MDTSIAIPSNLEQWQAFSPRSGDAHGQVQSWRSRPYTEHGGEHTKHGCVWEQENPACLWPWGPWGWEGHLPFPSLGFP